MKDMLDDDFELESINHAGDSNSGSFNETNSEMSASTETLGHAND